MENSEIENQIKNSKLSDPEFNVSLTPVGLGPWSFSKLKTLRNCPQQFYLKYLIKLKPTKKPPVSVVTETGKAAHRILEHIIGGKSVDQAYKMTHKEYASVLTPELWTEHVISLEHSIFSFKQRMDDFAQRNKVKRYLQELRIGVTKNWEPTGFFANDVYYRGVIDLAIQMENKVVIFIDHKTGAPAEMGIRNFQDQLNVYKVLFHHGIEPLAGATAGIHFIRSGEVKMDEHVDVSKVEGVLKNTMEMHIEGAIDSTKEIGYFKHSRGSYCQWCDFNNECKAGKFKELSKQSAKWFEIKKIN